MTGPDALLLQAVLQGDSEALARLYRAHVTLVYRYIRRRTPTTEVAEDLTSETFLAVVEQIRSFRLESSFQTWILTIARRRIGDYWRRQYRLPPAACETVLALLPAPADHAPVEELPESRPDLTPVLARLPERQRRVLECRFLEGKTVAETAAALQLSEGNVKVIQHRAIAQAARLASAL